MLPCRIAANTAMVRQTAKKGLKGKDRPVYQCQPPGPVDPPPGAGTAPDLVFSNSSLGPATKGGAGPGAGHSLSLSLGKVNFARLEARAAEPTSTPGSRSHPLLTF